MAPSARALLARGGQYGVRAEKGTLMIVLPFLLMFALVTGLSWLLVRGVRVLAVRCGVVDVPNERSSHAHPIPLGGGLAIVLIASGAALLVNRAHPTISARHAALVLTAALLVAGISLIDDIARVPSPIRMAVHLIAGLTVVLGYGYWSALTLPVLGTLTLGTWGIVVTLLWVVGLTNAYNFMDGIDGMAAGQAVMGGLGWAAVGFAVHRSLLIGLGLLVAASSLGFLLHNWHPASIFMGDVGATFLGFTFSVLPIIGGLKDPRLALVGLLLVWPAVFDSGFTVLNRLRRRQNILAGHREFLFHRLVESGWSHAQAASLYLALPLLGALLAMTWAKATTPFHLLVVLASTSACLMLWLLVKHQERYGIRSESHVGAPVAASNGGAEASVWDGTDRRTGKDRRAPRTASRVPAAFERRWSGGRRITDRQYGRSLAGLSDALVYGQVR